MRLSLSFRFRVFHGVKHSLKPNRLLGALCLAGLGLLPACTYRGGIDQPFTQKVAWFSYLNGDDMRAVCVPGAAKQYRLVYNGEYDRQVRTYEILADSGGGSYTARVQRGGGLSLLGLSFSNLGSLGGWTAAQTRLTAADMAKLEQALSDDTAFSPPPPGMNLASEEFFWTFVGCRNGEIVFNAWRYGDDRFAALSFPAVLLDHDATGVAVNPPRDVGPIDRRQHAGAREDTTPRFDLAIGANGLLWLAPRI